MSLMTVTFVFARFVPSCKILSAWRTVTFALAVVRHFDNKSQQIIVHTLYKSLSADNNNELLYYEDVFRISRLTVAEYSV